jgi:type IV pilus assembly protein PilY1
MHYYKNDLAPSLPDQVPGGPCDTGRHQRMRTHAFHFGVNGTISLPEAVIKGVPPDLCRLFSGKMAPFWPKPETRKPSMTDDLLHAVLNGRGIFFGVDDISYLIDELSDAGSSDDWIFASGPTVDKSVLDQGATFFQAGYLPGAWVGEVFAFAYDPSRAEVDAWPESAIWRASDHLSPTPDKHELRRLVTYSGHRETPRGVPFRYVDLSDGQKRALGSDLVNGSQCDRTASELLDYVRGREFTHLRKRSSLLGDIVHSSPVLAVNTLFVGANDGMLHAFNAETGHERFAYVPNHLFHGLEMLSLPEYSKHHRFFVDATPYVGEVLIAEHHRRTYLIGGLGKGGKGYFCLLLQERKRTGSAKKWGAYDTIFSIDDFQESASEQEVSRIVMWEYPACPEHGCSAEDVDPDVGYSFGQGYVVNANAPMGVHRSVAIFGNGYGSDGGKAVLYIVDAGSGQLIRKIDTGAGEDNGLSTPALVDVDLDRRVDYVYAGDLRGNLWKFDLTADDPDRWGVAYGNDLTRNGVIDAGEGDHPQPVFQAGRHQSITGRPDVMSMAGACAPGVPGYLVVFGTGRLLEQSDLYETGQQSVYAISDFGKENDGGGFLGQLTNRSTGVLSSGLILGSRQVVDQFTQDGIEHRIVSDSTCEYDGVAGNESKTAAIAQDPLKDDHSTRCVGWFFDFPVAPDLYALPGERVTGNVTIRNGQMLIVSFAPNDEACGSGGDSWIYILNACGKDNPDKSIDPGLQSRRHAGLINEPWVILKNPAFPKKDVLVGSDHSRRWITQEIEGEKWGKVFWQHSVND